MLVEVGWEMERRRLGLLVCDGVSSDILLGYDWGEKKELSAEEAAPLVREALVRRYDLSPGDLKEREGDPICWACDEWEAYKRFEQIVGESRALPPMEVSGEAAVEMEALKDGAVR